MRIDLHCDGVEPAPVLREYVTRRMSFAIGRFRDHIQWARVKVADVNGPRGGNDKRCVVQLRLRLTDAERQRNQYRERLDRAGLLHRPRQDNNRRGPGGSHMTLD